MFWLEDAWGYIVILLVVLNLIILILEMVVYPRRLANVNPSAEASVEFAEHGRGAAVPGS